MLELIRVESKIRRRNISSKNTISLLDNNKNYIFCDISSSSTIKERDKRRAA